jgi:ribosome-associated heat shock protein Hsp15
MDSEGSVRIDKWLWAVRIYKTRSQASEECKKGRVLIGEVSVKPSRTIKINEVITIKKLPAVYLYRVKGLIENRVSAKLVQDYAQNITPDEELTKLEAAKTAYYYRRDRGTGRPTKKERRDIEKFNGDDFGV